MNAFESVRLKPEPMPPLVRALLAPANSPVATTVVGPKPRAGSKWRTGKPLHASWWLTRLGYSKAAWRWWDYVQAEAAKAGIAQKDLLAEIEKLKRST